MADHDPWDEAEASGQVLTEEEVEVERPPLYRVILINDDYTPMDFVVWLIENVFHKPKEESVRLMLKVHQNGSAICGLYPYDVARTKAYHVKSLAQKNEHPLECIIEAEEGDKN